MKKLLSILTISTLTVSVPTPLLANTTLTRVKRNVGATDKDVNNQNTPILKTDGADIPTQEQIKQRLKEKNPNLDITKINIANITNTIATITVSGYSSEKN